MKQKILRILLPIVTLGICGAVGFTLLATAPKASKRPARPHVPIVETLTIQPVDYIVKVKTRGTVTPRTQSALIPEVAGRIVYMAPNFRNGGFIETGQPLASIDPRDYENAVTIAHAELAKMRLALSEVKAQAEQAKSDWMKLGMEGEPSDLVLHRPQLVSAQAAVAAAMARLNQAKIDLERTQIRAPYAGRVLEKKVDVGQYVSPGSTLATIYAVDFAEVRLPLTDHQAAFINLPESYRGESIANKGPSVILSATIGSKTHHWKGRIVRTEGSIDTLSHQIFVVAQVDDPYARRADGSPPLKVGQFVKAAIDGRTLSGMFTLPRDAVRSENEIIVVTPDNTLERRHVKIVWRDSRNVVVADGLTAGERVSLTPIPYASNGALVQTQKPHAVGYAKRAGRN